VQWLDAAVGPSRAVEPVERRAEPAQRGAALAQLEQPCVGEGEHPMSLHHHLGVVGRVDHLHQPGNPQVVEPPQHLGLPS
jgi:hypothetical protein